MNRSLEPVPPASPATDKLLAALAAGLKGEVRHDRLIRALYATDASIYQIIPDGVVFPRTVDDVAATARLCAQHGVPLTARGAGTGLTGGAVNRGLQMDLSRHLNRVLEIDPEHRVARVEPGVVLDELNRDLRRHGLQFAPDVATSDRATIGGMIANNSCGARSVVYGRTVDHVISLDVVLSDGSRATFGRDHAPANNNPLAARAEETLRGILASHHDEIAARYPRILRSNGGYGLDRLRDGGRLNTEALLCGSEGTLALIVGATLNLVPLPTHRGLCVIHYRDLLEALGTVPAILEHRPAAVELLDHMILSATRGHPHYDHKRWFLDGDPDNVLIVELFAESADELERKLRRFADDMKARGIGYAWPIFTAPAQQADVWEVRKAGTGLLMCRPGDAQPYDFIEDSAVDPSRLREFIAALLTILREEGVEQTGFYAHASVGCLHIRPVLNLREKRDILRLRRIGDRTSSLAIKMGGTMTGEHGDGIVRSEWIAKLYGPALLDAFRRIKTVFDPHGILNPGKIVDPLPMDANLRQGEGYAAQAPLTVLDFSAHGGMAGLAGMCSGLGHCRQRLVATMCPSYQGTGDELHTVRARANALRIALSNRDLLDGLADPALDEVMDLCLSCKACKTECPTGVDMARLKAEWLHRRNERLGVPPRSRLVASSPKLAVWGARLAPLSNWLLQSSPARWMLEALYGLDRRMPPPAFARQTFRSWWRRRGKQRDDRPSVVYFVDTWTNFHEPQVGIATVRVLEALGYSVIVPPTVCCGRPALSKGMLSDARKLAEQNVALLAPYADRGVPIVCAEPSCTSAMLDEWPQLVRHDKARVIAGHAMMVETLVARTLRDRPDAFARLQNPDLEDSAAGRHEGTEAPRHEVTEALRHEGLNIRNPDREGGANPRPDRQGGANPRPDRQGGRPPLGPILYHGHCHQKTLVGTADALAVLAAATGGRASEINSGCCGMAGSFGHEREHYEVAHAIGEQRLFPAVRARGDAQIAISGFSCRQQIAHHCGVHPRHVIELVAEALSVT